MMREDNHQYLLAVLRELLLKFGFMLVPPIPLLIPVVLDSFLAPILLLPKGLVSTFTPERFDFVPKLGLLFTL